MLEIFILIVSLLVVPITFMSAQIKKIYIKTFLILVNILILLLGLTSFFIIREFTFLGVIILFIISLGLITASIILLTVLIRVSKEYRYLLFLLILVLTGVVAFFFLLDWSEKIALKIEFPKIQKQIESYINYGIKNENIIIYQNYIGSIWDRGFLGNYSIIIYDPNNNFESLHKQPNNKNPYYQKNLKHILKIKDYYYRCNICE